MNRADLQQLAELRIAEAEALLALPVPLPDGAYYLAGYAVECALKACIAKGYGAEHWPEKDVVIDCHTHSIVKLVRLAGLGNDWKAAVATNSAFQKNWDIVKDWSERSRYERHALTDAQELFDAINDAVNGVFPWIKVRW